MKGVLREYLNTLKGIEVEDPLDLVFYRPLGYLLVKLLAPSSVTPNQVTLLSVVFGVAASICYAEGSSGWLAVGGGLCLMYNVLDCTDGQLARLSGTGTEVGRIIDGLGDYVVTTALFIGIGIGLVRSGEDPTYVWLIVAGAGLSTAVLSILVDFYRTRFLDVMSGRPTVLDQGFSELQDRHATLQQTSGWTFKRVVLLCYEFYSRVQKSFLSSNRNIHNNRRPDPETFHSSNKAMIRLWTLIGPTMLLSFLITCSFLDALEVYLWGILTAGNALGLLFLLLQRGADRRVPREAVS